MCEGEGEGAEMSESLREENRGGEEDRQTVEMVVELSGNCMG